MRQKQSIFSLFLLSSSSRRAWIEITVIRISLTRKLVALLVEGVDRNISTDVDELDALLVALLAEGVDRNLPSLEEIYCSPVALLAEGVDRNKQFIPSPTDDDGRPPRGGRG